ncbi:ATPase [Flexivirga endophytica]|uniref:histidine kinase n=1 Tax=Flexivirga endophytica TaxID=1849103 RepID=A0A916T3X0_9MICO|nr:sensor histidine kinase [Flexivirga endophytica]GGB30891.1 ATPase [Flexivirga endophytica]GHB51820.1 ATPase [Flexivirga endophytica]
MPDSWRSTLTIDDSWTRPLPPRWWRVDGPVALIWLAVAAICTEGYRAVGALAQDHTDIRLQYLYVVVPCAALVVRRRFPVATTAFVTCAWVITGQLDGRLTTTLGIQFVYLFAIYSGAAWGRRRVVGAWVIGGCLALLAGWVVYVLFTESYDGMRGSDVIPGWLGATVITVLTNVIYLGGAVLLGILEWRNLRRRRELEDQARTIDLQAVELRRQAVDAERLRIARELHDVVAHHVSVIGVQAGAARRVLDKQPDAARDALTGIERSSRSAVAEMRALLGTLRSSADIDRAPTPGLDDVDALVSDYRATGLAVDWRVVDDRRAPTEVPPGIGLAIYRTVQEALANVQRHSSATTASVVTRFGQADRPYAEVEIVDAGRARPGTAGTGLGLVGMRERVEVLGGEAEIGPRQTGGFRVRVRLPFD